METKGQNARIRYGLADSLLGRLLVARTEVGLCAVALGDTDEALLAELQDRFPRASEILPAPGGLPAEIAAVLRFLDPPHTSPLAPLPPVDLAGTPFEQRVWAAMCRIPAGETMEYGRFAEGLGYKHGARAVGAAIGKNPLALLFPCHRLVAKGGGLHRYRWGVARKEKLLAMERAQPGAVDLHGQGLLRWGGEAVAVAEPAVGKDGLPVGRTRITA